MHWLHNLLDQLKYCILDLAVLALFCIGVAQILWKEANRFFDFNNESEKPGTIPADTAASRPAKARNRKIRNQK